MSAGVFSDPDGSFTVAIGEEGCLRAVPLELTGATYTTFFTLRKKAAPGCKGLPGSGGGVVVFVAGLGEGIIPVRGAVGGEVLGAFLDEAVNAGEEVVGEEGFEAEVGVEVAVLIFGFEEPADDKDGDVGVEAADFADEFSAGHAGHDVVGDDEVDGRGVFVVAILLEGSLRAEDGDDEKAGPFKDCLSCSCLHCVVVDEEDCCLHAVPGGGVCRPWIGRALGY